MQHTNDAVLPVLASVLIPAVFSLNNGFLHSALDDLGDFTVGGGKYYGILKIIILTKATFLRNVITNYVSFPTQN